MRRVDMRFSQMSAAYCDRGVASCPIDACTSALMGSAKPNGIARETSENSRQWSSLWRPPLHMVGVTVKGLFEQYWVMDQDVPKDSNMECTCLSLALDKAKDLLSQKGLRLPEFISIQIRQHWAGGEKPARRQVDVMDPAQWHCPTSAGWMRRAWAFP